MARPRFRLFSAVSLVIAVAAVSLLSRGSYFQLGAVSLALVAAIGVLLIQAHRRAEGDFSTYHVEMLVICWVVLSILPPHNFVGQSSVGATRNAAASSIIELGYFSVVLLVAARVIRERSFNLGSASPPLRFFIIPLWVGVSGLWSPVLFYAVVRGYQFATIGALGWATVLVIAADRDVVHGLLVSYMRWMVLIIGTLAVSGHVIGPVRSQAGAQNLYRFSWIGAGPNVAGPLLVVALLFLVVAGARLRIALPVRLVIAAALVFGIYGNQSRSSLVGLAFAVLIVVVRMTRERPRAVAYLVPFAATAAYIVSLFHWDFIWGYLSRGQSSERLANANGRASIWGFGINSLEGPFDWLAGHGYGITRILFIEEKAWAGSAHSSPLALLVGVGLVGLVLFLGLYGLVIRDVLRTSAVRESPLMAALIAAISAGFFDGLFNDRMAEPGDGFAMFMLCAAVVLAWRIESELSLSTTGAGRPTRDPDGEPRPPGPVATSTERMLAEHTGPFRR